MSRVAIASSLRWDTWPRPTLSAIIALSLVLRVWRLGQGLPDFLDEAIPFKQALEMWGWDTGRPDLNPHFFNYPTLAIYLHYLVQQVYYAVGAVAGQFASPNDYSLLIDIDPTGPVIAARLLGFAADAVSVWMAWRIGERLRHGAGALAAMLLALSPVFIVTARTIHVDSVMTALAASAVDCLLVWRENGGRRRLAAAAALIGLAAGAKYNAGVLVVPMAWVLWERSGWRGLRLWPLFAAAALAFFILSSPWVVLDFSKFWVDFASECLHMKDGHLGVVGITGATYYIGRMLSDPGPVALLLLLASLVGLRRVAGPRGAAVTLWLGLLPLVIGLLTVRMEAERYLEPVLLLAAPLAAAAALDFAERIPWRPLLFLVPVVLLAPTTVGGLKAAIGGRDNTQQQARRWCEAKLDGGELLVQEAYGVKLLTPFKKEAILHTRYFNAASSEARRRFLSRRVYNVVSLPMASSGRIETEFARRGAQPLRLTVFSQATDINQIFYDPRLLDGVDYLLVSGAMRRRYAADPERYAAQNALYLRLDSHCEVAARFAPGHGVIGPEIVIYRLGEAFWRELRDQSPPLDLFWWARSIPMAYRQEVEAKLLAPAQRGGDGFVTPSGQPAGWVISLRRPFDEYVIPFELEIGMYLANRNQTTQARRHAATILAVAPEVGLATQLFSHCAMVHGDIAAARLQVETTLQCEQRLGLDTTDMREELARIEAAGVRLGLEAPPVSQKLER